MSKPRGIVIFGANESGSYTKSQEKNILDGHSPAVTLNAEKGFVSAGTVIAVHNALDEVKAAADYICDANDNDGVAKWLEENVL